MSGAESVEAGASRRQKQREAMGGNVNGAESEETGTNKRAKVRGAKGTQGEGT